MTTNTTKVDFTKPVQTVDGSKARYVGHIADGSGYEHLFAVGTCGGREAAVWADDNGKSPEPTNRNLDIINAPPSITSFINVYGHGSFYGYPSYAEAKSIGAPTAKCIVKLVVSADGNSVISADVVTGEGQ